MARGGGACTTLHLCYSYGRASSAFERFPGGNLATYRGHPGLYNLVIMEEICDFDLRITAYTPATIPMDRLARYMLEFAALMGSSERVHFGKLRKGSTHVIAHVDRDDVQRVSERLALAHRADAPSDMLRSIRNINALLREDGARGTLKRGTAQIFKFPGVDEQIPKRIGPIREAGVLDGEIVRVGGKDRTIHIQLVGPDGQDYKLVTTSRDVAKSMANHLFCPVRVTGTGTWSRNEEAVWELESFSVQGFEPIEERSLIEAVAALQAVEGSDWKRMEDPLSAWQKLRSN